MSRTGDSNDASHRSGGLGSQIYQIRAQSIQPEPFRGLLEILRSSHLVSAPEKPRTPLVSARSGGIIQRHKAKRLRRTENRNRERREPETRYRRWRRRPTQACDDLLHRNRDQMLTALGLRYPLFSRKLKPTPVGFLGSLE